MNECMHVMFCYVMLCCVMFCYVMLVFCHVLMYVCMYVRTYVRMYACMHVCMYNHDRHIEFARFQPFGCGQKKILEYLG